MVGSDSGALTACTPGSVISSGPPDSVSFSETTLGGQLNDFPIQLIVELVASPRHSCGLPAASTACGSEEEWFLVLLKHPGRDDSFQMISTALLYENWAWNQVLLE